MCIRDSPREDYHLSLTTLGDYHPLEKIITSHSLGLGECHPFISLTITLGDNQSRNKVTCRPLLDYFIPYPFFCTIILVQLFVSIVRVMGWEH